MIARLRGLLHPPSGRDVRRLVAFLTLAVALPRLPGWPGPATVYPLRLLPQEWFGWLTLLAGLLLLATLRWRLRVRGRLAALFALAVWATLAAATTSATSMMIDLLIMYALLGEILARHNEL